MDVFKELILFIKGKEKVSSKSEILKDWNAVLVKIRHRKVREAIIISSSLAAAIAVMLVMALHYSPETVTHESLLDYATSHSIDVPNDKNIRISVPGRPEIIVETQDVNILQSDNGTIIVDSEKNTRLVIDAEEVKEKDNTEFNQLVVPKGRRSHLTLADGTRIWMNSGSRVVYPSTFSDRREIFIDGEAYLEVAKNDSCPFIVFAKGCCVEVKGTAFNISAYEFDKDVSVVLVHGKVNVSNSEKSVTLEPGEMVTVNEADFSTKTNVNVENHISWVHNILVCDDESLENIFSKLRLCYGQEFVIGPGVSMISVTGKLYLKEDLHEVLCSISYSVPIKYEERNGVIYVLRNNVEDGQSFIR